MEFNFNVRVKQEAVTLSYDVFSLESALSLFADWYGRCEMVCVLDLSTQKFVATYGVD